MPRMHAMNDAKKTGKTLDWVPLVEGAQMIVRLGPHVARVPWPREVRAEAASKLLEALRSDRIASRGYRNYTSKRERLSSADWTSLRAYIDNNRLIPPEPSPRRNHPDWIGRVNRRAMGVGRVSEWRKVTSKNPAATSDSLNQRPRIEQSGRAATMNADHHTIGGYFSRCP
jgi:hypothetical protein